MTELATLARPYAEAAFKSSKEAGNPSEWSNALQFMAIVVRDGNLSPVIDNPRVGRDKLSTLLLDICQDQVIDAAKNLLRLLIQNDKLKLLPSIAGQFEQLRAEDEGYVNVKLFSAYALTKAEQNKYVGMLEKLLNKKVNAAVSVDKSLIGGIVAKAGDKVLDGSIKGQLNQLAKRL